MGVSMVKTALGVVEAGGPAGYEAASDPAQQMVLEACLSAPAHRTHRAASARAGGER